MSEWNSGTFNPGPFGDWIQGVVGQVTGNLRGMVGFPREEMVRNMDDFALRSIKRHLEARQADLYDMIRVINQEMDRREQAHPSTPESADDAPTAEA